MVTFGVTGPGLSGALVRFLEHGVAHGPVETYSNGVQHVEVLDRDGNSLSLASLP